MFSYSKKLNEDSNDSIINDYELLLSMYHPDDIKEIINNEEELKFILRINYIVTINSAEIIESIKRIKLKDICIEGNNELLIPYWIQFNYNKKRNILNYNFYILWIKDDSDAINKIKEEINTIEEPYLYNVIEIIKNILDNILNEENIISFLSEIKLNSNQNLSLINTLFILTKANQDCDNFLYEEKNEIIKENKEIINNKENKDNKESNEKINEYELFFEKGGVKSEILVEKDYAFQSHAINVKNMEDVNKYKNFLMSNNKIKKATRNVFAFRFKDEKNNNIVEDYDDDGEHYAGTRILGYLQKIKIYNILILVSRFNGDLHLKQHSTKYLTSAEILIKNYKNLFQYE